MKKTLPLSRDALILAGILLLASALRFWGIGFGLPHTQARPDEDKFVMAIDLPLRYFSPRNFIYPTLYTYLLFAVYALYYLAGRLSGAFGSPADLALHFASAPENFYLLNRSLAAVLGIATVALLFLLGRRDHSPRRGLLAAFLLSGAYLHVRNSHFGVSDVPLTFFCVLAVLTILRLYQTPTLRNALFAGIFAGLATSVKYTGILLALPATAAVFFSRPAQAGPLPRLLNRRSLLFCLGLAAGFLCGTPFALIDFKRFLADTVFAVQQTQISAGFYPSGSPRFAWGQHLRFSLMDGHGVFFLAAAILGTAIMLRDNWRRTVVVMGFAAACFIVSGNGFIAMTRYMVPILPFFCLAAAAALDTAGQQLRRRMAASAALPMIALTGLIVSVSLYNAVRCDMLLARKDTRVLAAEWILQNLPEASTFSHLAYPQDVHALLQLPASREFLLRTIAAIKTQIAETGRGRIQLYLWECRLKQREASKEKTLEEWTYDPKTGKFSFVNELRTDLPAYLISLEELRSLALPERKILANSYRLIKAFVPYERAEANNRYEAWDAFYLPFTGFRGIRQPGPFVHIFERVKE